MFALEPGVAHERCDRRLDTLKVSYRDLLCDGHPSVRFVHLVAPFDVVTARITGRRGHHLPASLLGSQLATLEALESDEPGTRVDTTGLPAAVADRALRALVLSPVPAAHQDASGRERPRVSDSG
jgi:carbohydrate kinase (thermoresistant glucokinase family)